MVDSSDALRNRNIFITGGTGFIGKWMIGALLTANDSLDLGCKVALLSRNPRNFKLQNYWIAGHPAVELIGGDVRSLSSGNCRFDYVIHGATDVAKHATARGIRDVCTRGTKTALEFAKAVSAEKFLLISSGAVYGKQPPNVEAIREDALKVRRPRLTTAYALGKQESESISLDYGALNDISIQVARCFSFIGPWMATNSHFAAGNFIRDAVNGNEIIIRGDGTPIRTYLYGADLACWLWEIVLKGSSGSIYNVGGSEQVTIHALAELVRSVVNKGAMITRKQDFNSHAVPERYVPDVSLVKSNLSLVESVSTSESIRRTANWFRGSEKGKY
jgi:nucleoside-diphosphate-sugar epimerase